MRSIVYRRRIRLSSACDNLASSSTRTSTVGYEPIRTVPYRAVKNLHKVNFMKTPRQIAPDPTLAVMWEFSHHNSHVSSRMCVVAVVPDTYCTRHLGSAPDAAFFKEKSLLLLLRACFRSFYYRTCWGFPFTW